MATALDRRKSCPSFIILFSPLLVLTALSQVAEGYDRRRGYESGYGADYSPGYGDGGYGGHGQYGHRSYHPKRHCHDDYDRYNNDRHGKVNDAHYGPYQEHEYGAYGNAESHHYEHDYGKKGYGPKRRDAGYRNYGSHQKPHFIKDGLDHKGGYHHHDYDLGDIILPLPKYHYIPKDESPIYPVKEGYGGHSGNYGYDNNNNGYGDGNDGYDEKEKSEHGGGSEGYEQNAQPRYEQNANQQPNYEQYSYEQSGHDQPTYEQNNYDNQNGYENNNQNGYEQNGHGGAGEGYEEPNNNYQGGDQGEMPDKHNGHQGGHGGNNYDQGNTQDQTGVPQGSMPQGNGFPNGNSQNPPLNDQQRPVNDQQNDLHLPDRIPPPVGSQQPSQGHAPGFQPSGQQTVVNNDQNGSGNNQEQDQAGRNKHVEQNLNNGQFNDNPQQSSQHQEQQVPSHPQIPPNQNTGDDNQAVDPNQNSDDQQQQENMIPTSPQNSQPDPASNQPIQAQQQSNQNQDTVPQGQPKEKPTPSHHEPPPPGPIQCADRTIFHENEKCSAWFNCKLDGKTDGSTRPAACWSETDKIDPSLNIFDPVTKSCVEMVSLPDCGRDGFCKTKSSLGWHLVGGECTRIAYRCGDNADAEDPITICQTSTVVDPNARNQCVPEQTVPQCQSLITNVFPAQ